MKFKQNKTAPNCMPEAASFEAMRLNPTSAGEQFAR